MTIKSDLEPRFRAGGFRIAEREQSPPFVFISFGGSSDDESLVQASFSVTVVAHVQDDLQTLAAQVWRILWESDDYIPIAVVADDAPPGMDAQAVNTCTIFGSTVANWWEL